ncbi:ATP-dependent DNA ligase [Pluteus cervinus]|uniref:ATP-dependent DNA ligase n=1 Tax=Pluteus cervinus TaxID=181527 RepID=A0ACD3BHG4_9AGAR|nr:ATP-dependent DNA ligase [Pluteus cervinus]
MLVARSLVTRAKCMGRQQTLAKFFEMPKSYKSAAPQQANLKEFWGKKRSTTTTVSEKRAMEVDQDAETEAAGPSTSRPKSHKSTFQSGKLVLTEAESGQPRLKRRKVVDSDEEGSVKAAPNSSPAPTPATSPPPERETRNSAKQERDEDMEVDAEAVVSETSADEAEGGARMEAEEEDDDDGADIADSSSKTAQAALSRKDDVDLQGGWKVGEPVPYAALAKTFSLIEATTKRLEKTAILTAFFLLVIERSSKQDYESLLQAVYLCINRLSPDYIGIELGIGESLLVKAIGESTGRSVALIKTDLKKEGDLGLVAMNSKNSQKTLFKPKPLTISFVFSRLKEIALTSGHSSQAKKVSIITKLLAACRDFEAKYIVRSLEGKLRIGNAERSVLVSLANAMVLAEKQRATKKWSTEKLNARLEEGVNTLKAVYSELPTYDKVVPVLLEFGIDELRGKCQLTPGVPLKPMLAKPTKAIGEVLDRFENKKFTCEYKYDGERAQVHKLEDGTVGVFSRNSEDMSKKYPDLVEQLPRCVKDSVRSFVLDAEAVAVDRTTGKLMPFQELSKRKRKDVKVDEIQVRVCLFGFDLLYLNGEPLLQKSLTERRELLRESFIRVPGEFDFATSSDAESTEEIQTFLEESVKDGCEGLMVKMLESDASYYEPSRRSVNWLKLKKDYLAGVGDSLDLAVVGGYYGKGKRTNVYGAFLLACYDSEAEEFQTICKIGTGFSEEDLQSHYNVLKPLELTKVRGDIRIGGAKPDIWFEPKVVWEVLTADLSLSPIYTAAQGIVDERGISLRFPRFIRIRDDKSPEDATAPDQIAEMYERQALTQNGGKKKGKEGDDGFW